jgi:hypothetical protein
MQSLAHSHPRLFQTNVCVSLSRYVGSICWGIVKSR